MSTKPSKRSSAASKPKPRTKSRSPSLKPRPEPRPEPNPEPNPGTHSGPCHVHLIAVSSVLAGQIRFAAAGASDLRLSWSARLDRVPSCDAVVLPVSLISALQNRSPAAWATAIVLAYGPAEMLPVGFALGADDVLRDPWTADELIARLRARFRASRHELTHGGLHAQTALPSAGEAVAVFGTLSPTRRRLLAVLVKNCGRVVPRSVLASVLPGRSPTDSRAIDVHISAIRKEITGSPGVWTGCLIDAVRGEGYVLHMSAPGCG